MLLSNIKKIVFITNHDVGIFINKNSAFRGEGSTAQNSSAQKNCSTPKSQLLDTVWADAKKN